MAADALEMWTVYANPLDYPGKFVARKFVLDQPTATVLVAESLAGIRALLPGGLTCMPRHAADEAHIIEVWL